MTKKPKGRKYHHLFARGDVIYYERIATGKRVKLSTKTANWDEAASFRDLYEEKHGVGLPLLRPRLEVPTLADFAKRYLLEDVGHLAPTTLAERARSLAADGPVVKYLGGLHLDEIR